MATINILDHQTIDKIAAGEVVERPSSVVKELVENAIDAGANAVTVEIKDGGTSLIRVTDNGGGIEKSQVHNAFLRHATSKITSADDLTDLVSLGFRGEALASIAAVSMVELITKTSEELTGIRYVIEGGIEKEQEEIGAPEGTTVLVRNLFYNTLPRKKFLKQPQTEGSYAAGLMEHLAMSNPYVSFKFIMNGQTKFYTTGNGDLSEIIYRIYGKEISNELVSFQYDKGGVSIDGLLGKPVINRANRNYEIFYVNGRYIKSTLISKAIEDGYREYLMQHKFPFCVLHFQIDTGRIDVNVHPAKMEVRIADGPAFYGTVKDAIHEALHATEMIPKVVLTEEKGKKKDIANAKESIPEPFEHRRIAQAAAAQVDETSPIGRLYRENGRQEDAISGYKGMMPPDYSSYDRVRESADYGITDYDTTENIKDAVNTYKATDTNDVNTYNHGAVIDTDNSNGAVTGTDNIGTVARTNNNGIATRTDDNTTRSGLDNSTDTAMTGTVNNCAATNEYSNIAELAGKTPLKPTQMQLFEDKILSEQARVHYKIIGQLFDTYWLMSYEDKMLIIDQHAAHEKVQYERFIKHFKEHDIVSQTINPPIIVTLSGRERDCYLKHAEDFESLGFIVEEFGGNDYAVRGVPLDLYGYGEKEFFREILEELAGEVVSGTPEGIRIRIATMACKAAVKGNMRLSRQEAERLIDELLTLDNPYHCPHGRPTIISMTKYEIEKKFKRIVT